MLMPNAVWRAGAVAATIRKVRTALHIYVYVHVYTCMLVIVYMYICAAVSPD
jgi:hypothetical protein